MFNPSLYRGYFATATGEVVVSMNTPTLVLPADPARVYLSVWNNNPVVCTLSIDPNVGPIYSPWTMQNATGRELWWERHGILCTLPLFANTSGFTATLAWVTMRWLPPQDNQ